MRKLLIVVDMQNDFIDGALGTKEALAIVGSVSAKIVSCIENGYEVLFTRDTHPENYLETNEGKHLPVKHCIEHTNGWEIREELMKLPENATYRIIDKPTFGYLDWKKYIPDEIEEIKMIGLCTDICVVSNALILKAMFPETEISVDPSCCAGVTPETHEAALATMKMCQVTIES